MRPQDYGLGCLPEDRPEQANYPLSALLDAPAGTTDREYRLWRTGLGLNQRTTATCVGHAWAHRMQDAPIRRDLVDPFEVYRRACDQDPFGGNNGPDYDYQFGTSVDAGAKACRDMGLISAYHWATSLPEADEFLLTKGPLVASINWWYSSFTAPRAESFGEGTDYVIRIAPDAAVIGSHAVVINGRDRRYGAWRIKNSWGSWWGDNGHAWIFDADLQHLLETGGKFCAPKEVRPEV